MSKESFIILTPGFPKDEKDSTCLPMQQSFVQTLKSLHPNLEIFILSFQYPYVTKQYCWNSIQVQSFNGRNKGGVLKLINRIHIYRALNEIKNRNTIKGLLSFWYGECALVGNRFAKKNGLKHKCWLSGQDARNGNSYARNASLEASELIALSDFLQTEFARNYKINPSYVVPPGLLQSDFTFPTATREIDILATGSLIPLKRYSWLPEIVAALKYDYPKIKVVLVGKGPEEANLKKLIEHYNLENNFMLTGELSYPEVLSLMQKTKVFLHPSSYEGFSGVCLEAIAGGARVISFCQPMNTPIANWTIVSSKDEMITETRKLLEDRQVKYDSYIPFKMENTVQQMAELFGF